MELTKIREGNTWLLVYKSERVSAKLPVFYNPRMEINRNLTVCAVSAFKRNYAKPLKFCDALAASGAMGLRVAKEALCAEDEIVLNDRSPRAVQLIKKNAELNALENCRVEQKDANLLLAEEHFTVVDIDPFGSPVQFLDSAARGVWWKGMLCVTATDTAPLCGVYPHACFRKYGVRALRCDFSKELGIRILISSIIRACAVHGKAFFPLCSISREHFFRVMGKIERGEGRVNRLLRNFDYISYCARCGRWVNGVEKRCACSGAMQITGPIYLGELWNIDWVEEMKREASSRGFKREVNLLSLISSEARVNECFYFDLHSIAGRLVASPPKISKVLRALASRGYAASRTHFSPTGIKTTAPLEEIERAFKK